MCVMEELHDVSQKLRVVSYETYDESYSHVVMNMLYTRFSSRGCFYLVDASNQKETAPADSLSDFLTHPRKLVTSD